MHAACQAPRRSQKNLVVSTQPAIGKRYASRRFCGHLESESRHSGGPPQFVRFCYSPLWDFAAIVDHDRNGFGSRSDSTGRPYGARPARPLLIESNHGYWGPAVIRVIRWFDGSMVPINRISRNDPRRLPAAKSGRDGLAPSNPTILGRFRLTRGRAADRIG